MGDSLITPSGERRMSRNHVSNEKRAPGCLVYIGGYTTQLYRDYNKPL